jgi:ribonuclease E
MTEMLINAKQSDELRVAIVKENKIIDLDIEYASSNQKKANIYKGKISSIEPSLGAVFVDYGSERHGFLPIKDIARDNFWNQKDIDLKDVDIRKALKLNQEILIQVEKEERGNKGAALSTYISLAGSYLVLMPTNPGGGGISRRIEGECREQLRTLLEQLTVPDGMSVIIRTAGVGKNLEELQWDLDLLLKYWEAIYQAAADKRGMIFLIHQESDVVIRSIRDQLRQHVEKIIIDDINTFTRVKQYLNKINPEFIDKLEHYEKPMPLFSAYHIEEQIEQAVTGEVKLPSGGSIVIDHTEALVAVDINSARATKGRSLEETAYNTNLEAAREIPRQLKIRDIGGLIVIDFIDMLSTSNQRRVEDALREALKFDRARIQTGKISRFGLLQMSRQRLSSSLSKNVHISCPRCKGRGAIRSVESTSLAIIRSLEEQSIKAGGAQIQLQLPIDVATYLLNEHREEFNEIQMRENTNILLLPNPNMISPCFEIKISKQDNGKNPSHKKLKAPKNEYAFTKKTKEKQAEPAINQYLSDNLYPPKPRAKNKDNSLIKRIRDAIFGVNAATKPSEVTPSKPKQRKTQARKTTTQTGNRSQPQRRNSNAPKRKPSKNNNRTETTKKEPVKNTKSAQSNTNRNRKNTNNPQANTTKSDFNQKEKKQEPKISTQENAPSTQKEEPKKTNKETTTRASSVKTTEKTRQAEKSTQVKKPASEKITPQAPKQQAPKQQAPKQQAPKQQALKEDQTPSKKTEAETKPQPSTKKATGTPASAYINSRKDRSNASMQQVKTAKKDGKKEETKVTEKEIEHKES